MNPIAAQRASVTTADGLALATLTEQPPSVTAELLIVGTETFNLVVGQCEIGAKARRRRRPVIRILAGAARPGRR